MLDDTKVVFRIRISREDMKSEDTKVYPYREDKKCLMILKW